jgi:hypothetical protein
MKRVQREDLLDYVTYSLQREELARPAQAARNVRRLHVGEHLTFLFENALTIRYQIQEMMRVERIVRESDIRHELDTYNELLGADGELGCTLLVEIEDAAQRAELLERWGALPEHVYMKLEDGTRVQARIDERQRTHGKLSSVQYLKFPVSGRVPIALGCDFEEARGETLLTAEQRAALSQDLMS